MTEVLEDVAMSAIRAQVQEIGHRVPGSRWFFFGSVTTDQRPVGDIDVLVVYKATDDCTAIRSGFEQVCSQFPVHLLLMTAQEEAEVNFIQAEGAVEIALHQS